MGKCFFRLEKIVCPRGAEKIIVIKRAGEVVKEWLSCPYHVTNANYEALALCSPDGEHAGGSVRTVAIEGPKVRAVSTDHHPYVRISDGLHKRMIVARQAVGMSGATFIVKAIEEKVSAIEIIVLGKAGNDEDRQDH